MPVLALDRAEIAWEAAGDGPAVLLLHSGVTDRRSWDEVVARLGDRRTVRFDARGFGESRAHGPFDPVADALAVLDAAGVERAVVAGSSWGGRVALGVALAAPERVEALVLLAAAVDEWEWSPRMESFGATEDAAIEAGDLDWAVAANVEMWTLPGSPHAGYVAAAQRRAFELQREGDVEPQGPAVSARLREVAVPTHVVSGGRDLADFRAIARHLAGEIPGATSEEVAHAGHLLPLDEPSATAAACRWPR